jgi:hypothetical protein
MYQPFKTCPLCGQRAVVDMKTCGRCGYVYPCPPAPYYTSPVQAVLPLPRLRITPKAVGVASLWLIAFVVVVVFVSFLAQQSGPFSGTWYSTTSGAMTFHSDGSFEGAPPNWVPGQAPMIWKTAGPNLQITMLDEYPKTMVYQWAISDDGQSLTCIEVGSPREPQTYWRQLPAQR